MTGIAVFTRLEREFFGLKLTAQIEQIYIVLSLEPITYHSVVLSTGQITESLAQIGDRHILSMLFLEHQSNGTGFHIGNLLVFQVTEVKGGIIILAIYNLVVHAENGLRIVRQLLTIG